MRLKFLNLLTVCFLVGILFRWGMAEASHLPSSKDESTIHKNCDLCWSPTISDAAPPSTLQPHRQHRPPDSRPHRYPKGRYKIIPPQKHAAPSALGRRWSRRLPINQPIHIIDGDTFRRGSERIRVRGIDTPELNEPGGQAARQRLEQLLQEGPIRIIPHGQDVYGRTVADVFVDGRNVAAVLAQEGYAKPRS